ncbi:hypothetical protein DFY15_01160 [Escherichia coli]|nr:hypothetical protein [Escherichia coli]
MTHLRLSLITCRREIDANRTCWQQENIYEGQKIKCHKVSQLIQMNLQKKSPRHQAGSGEFPKQLLPGL